MSPEESGTQGANEPWLGSTNHQVGSNQEYDGYVADQNEQLGGDDADVVLDVPVLKIDEIDLEVEDLRLHVSLRAELADLVKINAGIDAYLDKVKLSVKGVEAQAVLRIGLQRVLDTLDRALEAINKNPQILGGTVRDASQAVQDTDQGAELTSQPEETTEGQPGDATGSAGQRAVDEPGNVTDTVPNGSKRMEGNEETGKMENRESEDGENDEVDATDAARREADGLGLKLSDVRGTGSGGRILVKDVKRAAERPASSKQN